MNKKDHVLNGVLLAVGLGYVLHPSGGVETIRTAAAVLVPVTLGALAPDIDTDFGKHRKTLHNVFFVGVFFAYPFFFDNLQYVWIGVVTHYVLDVVGSKRGIALFYPLWSKEFGLPIGVTTSSGYATAVTIVITVLELALVAVAIYYVPHLLPPGIENPIGTVNATATLGG